MNTHTPCSVQKTKKRLGWSRTPSKRESLPSARTRRTRKVPRRAAHRHTRPVSSRERGGADAKPPAAARERVASVMNVREPVRS